MFWMHGEVYSNVEVYLSSLINFLAIQVIPTTRAFALLSVTRIKKVVLSR